ncbi:MAG: tetratricopeptide repeat protein [Chitinispirillaceae bacterium]
MKKPAIPFSWNRDLAWGLLLFAATFLAYQPAWNGTPIWDDDLHMTPPELRSIHGLARLWTTLPQGPAQYFPLVHTVFWLEANLWGDSTLGYHLLNILLHVLSALLLVMILRKLGIRGAWFVATVFALHPVMVESVAWISELKNTLSGVFFLFAALTYLSYAETGKRRWYLSALGLFILGLLSKTTIVPFPLAMLAVIWWKRGRISWRRDIVPTLPFFLAGLSSGLITLYVERTHIGTRGPEFEFSLIERCLIAGRALWFYLGKIFLPVNLIFTYPRWSVSRGIWWHYLFPAAALMAGYILWAMRKVGRAPAAVFFYFTAMLLPYLGFLSLFAFRYSFAADHYQYLAAIGPIVIGVGLIEMVLGSVRGGYRLLKTSVSVILLLTLGMLSWKQSRMYSNAETLYRTTIRKNPDSWMAHNNLGHLLANTGQTNEAMVHFLKALEINPDYGGAHYNLGVLLAKMGRTDEAIAQYLKALKLNSNHAKIHNNLGLLLANMGRTDEAIAHYLKALELSPNHAETHNNVAILLAKMGRTDEALAHYQKALEINPNSAEVNYNLGILLADMGRTDEAIAHYQKALELSPNLAEACNDLGGLLAKIGRTDEAMAHFLKALEINPGSVDAHYNLGLLLLNMGRTDEAMAHFQKALEINPEAIGALKNLAFALVHKGQRTDAILVLQNTLALAKSAGNDAQAKTIAQVITQLQEAINSSQVTSKTHAQ